MLWITTNHEALGFIPDFLSETDPRAAREQLHANYAHGGGWSPIPGVKSATERAMIYPGDPPFPAIGWTTLREETVVVYTHAFVAIIQPDGSFEAARLD